MTNEFHFQFNIRTSNVPERGRERTQKEEGAAGAAAQGALRALRGRRAAVPAGAGGWWADGDEPGQGTGRAAPRGERRSYH